MQFQFTFEGNLAADVRFGITQQGHPRAYFQVIHNTRIFRNGQWADGRSITIGITCWRNLAQNVAHLKKGDAVVVEVSDDLTATVYDNRAFMQATARNVAVSARFSAPTSNRQPKNSQPTVVAETGGYDTAANGGYVEPTDFPPAAPAEAQPEHVGEGQAA